ncbi:MAG: hypothetical protein QXP27_07195 [Candidatus Methanomethyliaceae archaeon]
MSERWVVNNLFPDPPPVPGLVINFSGRTSFVNILPKTDVLHVIYSRPLKRWMYIDPYCLNADHLERIILGEEMRYLSVRGFLENAPRENFWVEDCPFGCEIGRLTRGPVIISEEAAEEYREITPEHILMINGVPVAVAPNPSNQ